jgi:iron complex transport system substrate-binding protein
MENKNSRIQPKVYRALYFSFFLFPFSFLFSCSGGKNTEAHGTPAQIAYAKGFTIEYMNDYTLVKVINPWDTTSILHAYVLIDRGKTRPKNLPSGDVLQIPVERIACISSIDASMIEMLGDLEKVKAMAETDYVKMPVLRKGLDEGRIADIGEYAALNMEKLINVTPDIVIVSPYQNMGYGKLETTGITMVENAGYLENTPLGRAEWIRFTAAFLKKDREAEALMAGIAERYRSLASKAKTALHRPTVFSEKKYGRIWHVPGGKSYMAHFFEDAGADYLWKDNTHSGSLSLDFETVYDKAENADFWIIKSAGELTYSGLKTEDAAYSRFKAWKNRKIIYSNTARNNYSEEGAMNPDLVLGDLIRLFHPEIPLPQAPLRYFERMN